MEPANENLFYTTLGQLGPDELGLDADGDIMALAHSKAGPCVLVIRNNGAFEVHDITQVPMTWPVAKAKLMMIAAPIPQEVSDARDAERERQARADAEELGNQIATEVG